MKPIFTRPARPEEAQTFLDWSMTTPNNEFDPEVARYATTRVIAAYNKDRVIAFLPQQMPMFLDSLAINPEADPRETTMAIKELVQNAVSNAHNMGCGEIFFLASNDETTALAESQMFEKIPYSLYRAKLKDLEGRS